MGNNGTFLIPYEFFNSLNPHQHGGLGYSPGPELFIYPFSIFLTIWVGATIGHLIEKKRLAHQLMILVILSGCFLAIPPVLAKYKDIRSGLFDIPYNAYSFTYNVVHWEENGIKYEYREKKQNVDEGLSLLLPERLSFSDAKISLLKYVENKEIHDEISEIPIGENILRKDGIYVGKGPEGYFSITNTIGNEYNKSGIYIDKSREIYSRSV